MSVDSGRLIAQEGPKPLWAVALDKMRDEDGDMLPEPSVLLPKEAHAFVLHYLGLAAALEAAEEAREDCVTEGIRVLERAETAEAKIAAFEADSETDDWLSHRHNEEFKRVEAAEAQRDTLERAAKDARMALRALRDSAVLAAAMDHLESALAGVAPPEEKP